VIYAKISYELILQKKFTESIIMIYIGLFEVEVNIPISTLTYFLH
jgi:hypothetical protein